MFMKQRLLLRLLLLASAISTHAATAADTENAIAIYQKDGQVAKFAFSEKPVVTYSGNDLVLTTSKTSVQYPIYMLQKVAFDVTDEIINDVEEVKREAQFRFEGGMLVISGGDPGSIVYLYDISGKAAGQYVLDSEGCATLPIQHLGQQLYIVRTTRFTFKFRKS